MNAVISETIRVTILGLGTMLGLGMQIPKIPAQRKFLSEFVSPSYAVQVFFRMCHAHSNAH